MHPHSVFVCRFAHRDVQPLGPECKGDVSVPLVCLHWAVRWRDKLWNGKVINIASREQALWIKLLANLRGSRRLRPVIELIRGIDAVHDVRDKQSWLHHLFYTSTRNKIRKLKLTYPQDGQPSPTPLRSLHWGLSKNISPTYTPYQTVTLSRVSFASQLDLLALLSSLPQASMVHLRDVSIIEAGSNVLVTRSTRRCRSLTKIKGHVSVSPASGSTFNAPPVDGTAHLRLALEALKSNPTCPLLRLSDAEQIAVQELVGRVCVEPPLETYTIQMASGERVGTTCSPLFLSSTARTARTGPCLSVIHRH